MTSIKTHDSVLCEKGLVIKLDHIRAKIPDIKKFNKFIKLFTVKENIKFRKNNTFCREKILKAYQTIDGYIILPSIRYDLLRSAGIISSTNITQLYESKTITNNTEMTIELYDYQIACIDHILETKIVNNRGTVYFQLGTGLGKTSTSIGLLTRLKLKTLVIVPSSKDLQGQWIDELAEKAPGLKTLAYNNKMKDSCLEDPYDVIVIVVNTFCKKNVDFIEKAKFGLVIIDEAHEFCSTVFSRSLWLIQAIPCVFGMSATPHVRKDELDHFVDQFLGTPLEADKVPGVNINKERFYGRITKIDYAGHPDYCDIVLNDNGDTNNALTLRKVVSDPKRIQLIINELRALYNDEANHGIFVFAEHRDYLVLLRDRLFQEFGEESILEAYDSINTSDLNIQVLRGGASKDLVQHVRKEGARIVLTTYGYSRRGIDLPNMTAMILVTPRRSGLMQVLGRITRKRSDLKKVRHVIDIVDCATIYKNQFYERKQVYDIKEWPITKRSICYDDV